MQIPNTKPPYDYRSLDDFLRQWTSPQEMFKVLDRSIFEHIRAMAMDNCAPNEEHCGLLRQLRDHIKDLNKQQ